MYYDLSESLLELQGLLFEFRGLHFTYSLPCFDTEYDFSALIRIALERDCTTQTVAKLLCCAQSKSNSLGTKAGNVSIIESLKKLVYVSLLDALATVNDLCYEESKFFLLAQLVLIVSLTVSLRGDFTLVLVHDWCGVVLLALSRTIEELLRFIERWNLEWFELL